MGKKEYKEITAICPWCNKGKTKADRLAKVNVYCQCGVCDNVYRANLKTLRTYKVRAGPDRRERLIMN